VIAFGHDGVPPDGLVINTGSANLPGDRRLSDVLDQRGTCVTLSGWPGGQGCYAQRFLSIQVPITNDVIRRPNQHMDARFCSTDLEALAVWADVTGVPTAA
jgi:hypothetical protein